MANNWQCPHIDEILDMIEDSEVVVSEELNTERQRIINVLSSRINQLVEEMPKQRNRRNINAPKNSALSKLARSNYREKRPEFDNTLMHEVRLFAGVTILLCDDCYRIMQRDIVVEILNDYVATRGTREIKMTTINDVPVRDNNFRSIG